MNPRGCDGATATKVRRRDLTTGECVEQVKGLMSAYTAHNRYRQAHHERKSRNQTTPFCVCGCKGLRKRDEQGPGVTRRRAEGIRKGGFP